MALERRDPLPAGTYSVFINEAESGRWSAWVDEHQDSVKVRGAVPQRVAPNGLPVFAVDTDFNVIWTRLGTAFYFEVTAPTAWVGLGLPDIETRSVAAWRAEKTENPEYVPGEDADPLKRVESLVLFAGAVYLGGILLQRALRS